MFYSRRVKAFSLLELQIFLGWLGQIQQPNLWELQYNFSTKKLPNPHLCDFGFKHWLQTFGGTSGNGCSFAWKSTAFLSFFAAGLLNCAIPFPSARAMVEVHVLGFVSFIFHQPKRLCRWQELPESLVPSSSLLAFPSRELAKALVIFLLVSYLCTLHQYYSSLACFYSCIFCWFQSAAESVIHFPSCLRRWHFSAGHYIPWLSGIWMDEGSGFGSSSGFSPANRSCFIIIPSLPFSLEGRCGEGVEVLVLLNHA